MAKCEVLVKSYINDREVFPGEIIEYSGKLGTNLRLVQGKEKPLERMDRDELLEYADAHKVEIKDPDNDKDDEIREQIRETLAAQTV